MNKKLFVILPSGALALCAFALVIHASQVPLEDANGELNASLESGGGVASLEEAGAVPPVSQSYDLSSHQTLSRVILLIRENYVEPERINSYEMFLAALDYIQKTVPEVMIDDTAAPERVKVSVGSVEQSFDLGGLDQLWEVTMALRDIFRFLQTQLRDAEQRREVEYAAINGMLSTLDPHSVLLKPESFDEVKLSTKGEFGGLGIVISIREGSLTIISPIESTPAARAGLKAKDKIVKIGEESTVNMNLEEAVQRLRGKPGTKVNIWVTRKGWTEAKRYTLTRAIIKIESVNSEMLEDGVGYLRIKSFQNNTYDDMVDHLERLRKKKGGELRGLVLDLRNNPGGLLDQAILVSDRFIDKGPLVITVGEGNRKREEKPAHYSGTERDYPIVVLVNGGSASASEIVSGALKNHDRALVIGQQTFGKGSVQVLYDFKDRSALKLTIAQYLTPGDVSIQSVGIAPDVSIMPATLDKEGVHLFVDDDAPREKDLDKHLDRHGQNTGQVSLEPALKIVHLAPTPPAEDAEAAEGEEEPAAEKFDYDFETRLAHDILLKATSNDRQGLIKAGMPLFQERAAEQEKLIEARMKELGVDWEKGAQTPESSAQVEVSVASKSKAPLRAGDTATLTATVRNSGNAPLYRVYGISASDNPLLKNLEFVFGKINAGEKKSWSVDIKLPDDFSARADGITLTLGDQGGHTSKVTASAMVSILEAPKPRFAYTMQVDDRARGNGDGVLQPNESVDLKVEVQNLGPGEARDAVVTLKNLAGEAVFLDRGREKVGALEVGGKKTVTLKFAVGKDLPEGNVEMRLAVWDSVLGSAISEELALPAVANDKGTSEARVLRVAGPGEVPIYAGAVKSSPVIAYGRAGGSLKSDARIDSSAGGQAVVWRRVEVQPGLVGYVVEDEIRAQKGSLKSTTKQSVRLVAAQAAPDIAVEVPTLTTDADVLSLHGLLTDDRALKDVFIFVNDKKVMYRALGLQRGADGAPVSAPLDVNLPLKVGSNTIAIVLRENDDMMSRKIFGVWRGQANAIAERTEGEGAGRVVPLDGRRPDERPKTAPQ